jgi:hypothetical protein
MDLDRNGGLKFETPFKFSGAKPSFWTALSQNIESYPNEILEVSIVYFFRVSHPKGVFCTRQLKEWLLRPA